MPPMARRNILAALLLLSLGTGYGVMTAALPDRGLPHTPGPAFFPWLIAGGLIVLASALLLHGLAMMREGSGPAPPAGAGRKGSLALAWFLGYLAALPYAGFLAASVPFFAGLMLLYGGRSKVFVPLAAIAVPVAVFCLFRYGFHIPLPRGAWW